MSKRLQIQFLKKYKEICIKFLIQNKTKDLQVHVKQKECHIESQTLIYSCSYILYA